VQISGKHPVYYSIYMLLLERNQTENVIVMECNNTRWIFVLINYSHNSQLIIFYSLYTKQSALKLIYIRISLENNQLEEYKYTIKLQLTTQTGNKRGL